jgi:hypothetical protein
MGLLYLHYKECADILKTGMNCTTSAEPKCCSDSRTANFKTIRGSDSSRMLDRNVEIVSASPMPTVFLLFNVHTVHYQTHWKRPIICTDCTTPLFCVLALTCFVSSLPSSGSLWHPPDLLEIQIGRVVYLKYITDKASYGIYGIKRIRWRMCIKSILYIFSILYILYEIYFIVHHVVITSFNLFYSTWYVIQTDALSVIYFRYTAPPICISSNSEGSNKLPDNDRLLPKHAGASM